MEHPARDFTFISLRVAILSQLFAVPHIPFAFLPRGGESNCVAWRVQCALHIRRSTTRLPHGRAFGEHRLRHVTGDDASMCTDICLISRTYGKSPLQVQLLREACTKQRVDLYRQLRYTWVHLTLVVSVCFSITFLLNPESRVKEDLSDYQ